ACLLPWGGQAVLAAQEPGPPAVDSIVVQGNQRLTPSQIIGSSGIIVHQPINYRDIQRAITALFQTGQFWKSGLCAVSIGWGRERSRAEFISPRAVRWTATRWNRRARLLILSISTRAITHPRSRCCSLPPSLARPGSSSTSPRGIGWPSARWSW